MTRMLTLTTVEESAKAALTPRFSTGSRDLTTVAEQLALVVSVSRAATGNRDIILKELQAKVLLVESLDLAAKAIN